jgi:hypothetical protein
MVVTVSEGEGEGMGCSEEMLDELPSDVPYLCEHQQEYCDRLHETILF